LKYSIFFALFHQLIKGKKILDVGCGIGRYSLQLALEGFEVLGIDKNEQVIKK
jgi:2-polyprenyl-3-methyl-5-hydroxy-6-metoxy-1,4-benzoquinol methylase